MRLIKRWLCMLLVLLSLAGVAQKQTKEKSTAQKKSGVKDPIEKKTDAVADEKKVRDMIAFLEYMLNTLGNSSTPIRDKEIVFTESYSKIFRDSKVQVEDDLDEERKVITNKDVVAYLKDVNFFFRDVRFEFTIENISGSTMPNGQFFYKVSTTRNMKGTTADHKPVNSTAPRFIEINYNPNDQDLKIVSMYTKEFNEKEALTRWWSELSYEWQSIFRKQLNLTDSISLNDLKRIKSIDALDISNNQYIQTLDPLSQFSQLRSLDIANTHIHDLTPIRNLTELTEVNISNTRIQSIGRLKYSGQLKKLNIANTDVTDIAVLEKFPLLETVDLHGTPISDFSPLAALAGLQKVNLKATQLTNLSPFANLVQLHELNISKTSIQDLSPIKELSNLSILYLDSTRIRSISALSNNKKLELLHINYTSVSDLTPLQELTHLEKIYCDQTLISREAADAFMATHPGVLVIMNSKDLKEWWENLSTDWKNVFSKTGLIGSTPEKEELAKLALIDSVNLTGYPHINTLEPLRKLLNLKVLIATKTNVNDLTPLDGHTVIRYLDISETDIKDLSVIQHLSRLQVLKADASKIENVDFFIAPTLKRFYADQTSVQDIVTGAFLKKNSQCLLIYKTHRLTVWWDNLPPSWKGVFTKTMGVNPTKEELHALIEQQALHVNDVQITSLSALSEFVRLTELYLSGTALTSLTPIKHIQSLKSLHATNSPIQKIDSLDQVTQLEYLDISNTPIDDIYVLWKLKNLKKLNCAGTQLKRLDGLQKLENLEYFDCSNTKVSRLDKLDYLPLKTLKCYNTKIPNRIIENFKASHPECTIRYYR